MSDESGRSAYGYYWRTFDAGGGVTDIEVESEEFRHTFALGRQDLRDMLAALDEEV